MLLKPTIKIGIDEEHTAAAVVLAETPAGVLGKTEPKRRRSEVLKLRLSPDELAELTELAQEAGMSRTDFILAAARGNRAVVIDGVPELMKELRRQGTNLNQLARFANQNGSLDGIQAIGSAMAACEAAQSAVMQFCVEWAIDLRSKEVR